MTDFVLNHLAEITLVLTALFMVVKKYGKVWAAKTDNKVDDAIAALLDKVTIEQFTEFLKAQAAKLETKKVEKKDK